jgi:hypothetical protein
VNLKTYEELALSLHGWRGKQTVVHVAYTYNEALLRNKKE